MKNTNEAKKTFFVLTLIGMASMLYGQTTTVTAKDFHFDGNKGLVSILFGYKNKITNLIIPEDLGITSLGYGNNIILNGQGVFEGHKITSIVIPNTVTVIGQRAFADCKNLTSITIPDSVTTISSGAFQGCTGLTSVIIGSSVTSIGQFAFEDCKNLTKVTFKAKLPPGRGMPLMFDRGHDLENIYVKEGAGTYTRQIGGYRWTRQLDE